MLACVFLAQKKLFNYMLMILVACLFHYSAVIMLPVYFIVNRTNTIFYNFSLFLFFILGLAAYGVIFKYGALLNGERYASYASIAAGGNGGHLVTAYHLTTCVFFLTMKRFVVQYRKTYDIFINIYLIGIVFILIGNVQGLGSKSMMRISHYFTFAELWIYPILLTNCKNIASKYLFAGFLIFFYLVYFILTTIAFNEVYPYRLNQAVINNFSIF
jgi:hypothetical protein